jgi:hypothetical protein
MTVPFWKLPESGKEIARAFLQAAAVPLATKKRLDEIADDILRVAALLPDTAELDELEKQFMEIMTACDWPPPLEVSLADVVELVKRHQQAPQAVVDNMDAWVLERCTEESLLRALESWRACPFCIPRAAPLEAAVRAHQAREYFCSIPVLLAQTEGLICDFFGMELEKRLTTSVRRKVGKSLELGASEGVSAHVRRALPKYYLDMVMSSAKPSSAPSGALRRNPILHGGDCTYGTLATSWKCLILFDTIVESLEVAVVKDADDLYHLPVCSKVVNAPEETVTYIHISRSPDLGGRCPCPLCGAPKLSTL